jgi:hypothetical protein
VISHSNRGAGIGRRLRGGRCHGTAHHGLRAPRSRAKTSTGRAHTPSPRVTFSTHAWRGSRSVLLTAASETGPLQYTASVVGVELGQMAVTAIGVSVILLLVVVSGSFLTSESALFSPPAHRGDGMADTAGCTSVRNLDISGWQVSSRRHRACGAYPARRRSSLPSRALTPARDTLVGGGQHQGVLYPDHHRQPLRRHRYGGHRLVTQYRVSGANLRRERVKLLCCRAWPHTPDVVSVRPTLRRHTAECSAE